MDESEKLYLLSQQDWDNIYPKLVYYTICLVKTRHWITGSHDLPKGYQVEDIVQEAITSVFTVERNWNPKKVPDILVLLKGIVRSKVSHLIYSTDHLKRINPNYEEDEIKDTMDLQESHTGDPIQNIEAEELWDFLWEGSKNDENMQLVLLCLDDAMKPREISDELDLQINQVYNILKRIKSLANKYKNRG